MNDNLLIAEKLNVARERGHFRTVDLFAGCGGLTLGFDRAGFRCISAVEIDDLARESHELNFGQRHREAPYAAHADITRLSPSEVVSHLVGAGPATAVDVVVGGPPCQAFSRLGRAALWRLAGKDQAHQEDERATMYEHYLRFVAALKPIAFVMENVREIGKFGRRNVAEEVAATASELGYTVSYTLLNAAWFGVPQFRERMFILGVHRSVGVTPSFPALTHLAEIPVGYSTARAGTGHPQVLEPMDHFVDHFTHARKTKPAVTAAAAFEDLPPITHHLDGRRGKGHPRRPAEKVPYLRKPTNAFTKEMRDWPGFKSEDDAVSGHVIRYTPRDYAIFARMAEGDEYPAALEVAEEIFSELLSQREAQLGKPVRRGSKEWIELRKKTVPPYPINRYPNKFSKMLRDRPARTVAAHIGKDSYSHIHFDSSQARCISLREAARLQSFPDGFSFAGSMNSQLKQIGNAVPPILARAVAQHLSELLLPRRMKN